MRHKLGSWVWVESSCTPVFRSEKGTIESIVTVTRDITERKQTEAKLQQALKMESIGQLTGGIAHDFNNLLTVVISNLDLLEEMSEEQLHKKMIDQAREAALRGAELTSRLLSFARKQSLRPEYTDISSLINNLSEMLKRTLGESIRIQTSCQTSLWNAKIDRTQFETALLNLALNSRDAMPHGGNLTISATNCQFPEGSPRSPQLTPGHYIRIVVQDTGSGMPPKVQERAFDPFFTTKEVGKGSGLGLSMVYGFIKQSGGDIELDSVQGQGTTIRLYLPKGSGATSTNNRSISSSQAYYQGQGELILVVEDQENVRNVVVEAIQRLGYNVLSAPCGEDALKLLQQRDDVSLLFSDIILPGGMNGIELSHHALALQPHLRVLFTSGFAEKAFARELWPLEHVQLLKKPYRRSELGRSLYHALHQTKTAS
ncbi:MAG: response regulator [Myxococcales bacterium]|nr:response regulator [Myxococcales bacterium]